MLFNSIDFALFLPLVFAVYWSINGKNIKWQNLLLLIASYVFYGWWQWKFLLLIAFSSVADYLVGGALGRTNDPGRRKVLLWLSLAVNLGLLGFFKYYNFFLENFASAFTLFGRDISGRALSIVLPVGISFYTFQTLSYTIDVYRRKLEPCTDFVAFATYVSFFPQLVAGPIERATNLLPQFLRRREFTYDRATDGMRQILWGLVKKVLIADQAALHVNYIFDNSADLSGSALLLGAVLFAFQIYGDFSGYSDIAIGTARLFGFDLMQNFAYPYFSRDIAEFWRRWHVSLSTWFRDYLYFPLGGSRGGTAMRVRNTFIIFIVSGFWHGANWTFIVWGLLNALYFLPLLLLKRNRRNLDVVAGDRSLPTWRELSSMLVTFGLTVIAWVFFRAESVTDALTYLGGIGSSSLLAIPNVPKKIRIAILLLAILVFLLTEWVGRRDAYAIERLGLSAPRPLRWFVYSVLFTLVLYFGETEATFIYFQF